ncbi:hypothetical protein AOLI_G00094200 [Acnodon oligacanthus]
MKTSFVLFPLVFVFGFTVGLVKDYIFRSSEMSWLDAQQYCRQHYGDLSTITTKQENDMVIKAAGSNFPESWIGLHRHQASSVWLWSDDEPNSYFNWKPSKPEWIGHCVHISNNGWSDGLCSTKLPFFCERFLVLVKENKTWEEAYEYCRARYKDLAFLSSEIQLNLAKKETSETQTVSVWTGLRFLAGEWLWVDGEPLGSLVSLPSCPAEPYRCGARNSKMNIWENRDCEEKLNFFCY